MIIVGGTVLLLLISAYVRFLWWGQDTVLWRKIALHNWIATSVTLCSLVIRWIVIAQAGLCTAVVARAILRNGAPIVIVPDLAIHKVGKSGPIDLVTTVSQHATAIAKPALILIMTLCVTTLFLQLTSTMLVSDLDQSYVEESLNTTKFLTTLSNDTKYHAILDMSPFYPDHILSATPEFPLFAQAARGLIHVSVNGLDYTGPSLRTFLPLYDPYLCMIRKCGQN